MPNMTKATRSAYEEVRSMMLQKTERMDWEQAIALYEELSTDIDGDINCLKEENELEG